MTDNLQFTTVPRDLYYHEVAYVNEMRDALEMFLLQWNAFGPNSEPGKAFMRVRNAAAKALGTDAPKYRAELFRNS